VSIQREIGLIETITKDPKKEKGWCPRKKF
jgi:hypothetical protein